MYKIREWLSLMFFDLFLFFMPYEELRELLKASFLKTIDEYLDEG